MTTKNKILFALVLLGLAMMSLALVGSMWIGFSIDVAQSVSLIGELLMLSAVVIFIGPAKFFKGMYLIFVAYMIYACITGIIVFESVLHATLYAVLAILLLASLVAIVFKSK